MKQQMCLLVCLCMPAYINRILHLPSFSAAPKGGGRQLLKVTGESEKNNENRRHEDDAHG